MHKSGAVRYAEKRRTGTCRFADRVATVSLDIFHAKIPKAFRELQRQTCVASIVAHFKEDDHLQVVSLGVGTKFLAESILRKEELDDDLNNSMEGIDGLCGYVGYGLRVRDCHAEVLARRAFRRRLLLEMKELSHRNPVDLFESSSDCYRRILKKSPQTGNVEGERNHRFELVSGVTLHFYSSSAPCGNAVLKKFSKMLGENYDEELAVDKWPQPEHTPILGHALQMGQFALLTKRDSTVEKTGNPWIETKAPLKGWPAAQSDDWCPPGTSIVWYNRGSIHTCSDKICRWNILGLQGSLLSSLLEVPIFMETLTVGRKFTACICRRAVCCRAAIMPKKKQQAQVECRHDENQGFYRLHHPTVMGTSIYMDDLGVLDMKNKVEECQDVRFDSPLCWAWWLGENHEHCEAECIDGSTGFALEWEVSLLPIESKMTKVSSISTASLLRLFGTIRYTDAAHVTAITSLVGLRAFKIRNATKYESEKTNLMTSHMVFKQWRRRSFDIGCSQAT